jgi:phosphatidylglycerophosphatase A
VVLTFHKLVATVLGIGYVGKGGGTLAAIACCLIWILIPASYQNNSWQLFITLSVCILGVWSGNVVDDIWGKDSSKVVIDEVAGMMITLLFIPVTLKYVAAGLILFRFFDIAKPLFIRKMEVFPGGWGVMADDVLAGVYAHTILLLLVHFSIF